MDNNVSHPDERFGFGDNWTQFSKTINDKTIFDAVESLKHNTGHNSLEGLTFLDAGCGSGLFSLAANNLDADSIFSFDYDLDSVNCTKYIKQKYSSTSLNNWDIVQGDVLDTTWLKNIGQFDITYSWGVLHHTGNMWGAFENIMGTVKPGGLLFISIYNDQGQMSKFWKFVKYTYIKGSSFSRFLLLYSFLAYLYLMRTVRGIVKNLPLSTWYSGAGRGMNLIYDAKDWIGGYPFEVARPEEIIEFFEKNKFSLIKQNLKFGHACNEYVFKNER